MSPLKWGHTSSISPCRGVAAPVIFCRNISQVGVALAKWFIFSIVILLGGTWAEHTALKR